MKGIVTGLAFALFCFAGCGSEESQVEEYVQDPRATAAETPDVTEPLGRPANDPASAVEAFILALRLGEGEKLKEMIYSTVAGGEEAPLAGEVDDLLTAPAITDWDEIVPGNGLPVEGPFLEGREVSARVYRGASSRVWRFTVVRNDAGWYLWSVEE